MAATANLTNLADIVKEMYQDGAPADLTMKDHPGYGLMKKSLWPGGSPWVFNVKKWNTQGKSKTFTTAQANVGYFKPERFAVTRVKDYVIAQVDGETILATRNDAAAFFNVLTEEIDSAFQTIGNVMAREFYQDGTGVLATAASVSTVTVTLTNPQEIRFFEVGQYLDIWDVSGTSIATDTDGDNQIVAVDHENGTFDFSADPTTWSTAITIAAGDGLGYMGDLTDGGSTLSLTALAGLEGWNPSSVTATAWFGVDRSNEPGILAGTRYSAVTNNQTYREAMIDACAKHLRVNGKFDYWLMHPENFAELEKELDTKVYFEDRVAESIGFRGLMMACPWGMVKVLPDQDCPYGVARGVDFNYLEMKTLDQVGPMILNYDSLTSLRLSDSDGIELRIGYYGNMACLKPNTLARLVLPA